MQDDNARAAEMVGARLDQERISFVEQHYSYTGETRSDETTAKLEQIFSQRCDTSQTREGYHGAALQEIQKGRAMIGY